MTYPAASSENNENYTIFINIPVQTFQQYLWAFVTDWNSMLGAVLIKKMCWAYLAKFWWKGAAGMDCDRRNQELPPSQTEPVPVNSRTDLLLASAEPVRDTGGTSAMIYLKRDHTMEQKSMGKKEWYGQIFTAIPIPHIGWEENAEELGVKLSLEKRRYKAERCFSFYFYFSISYTVANWQ